MARATVDFGIDLGTTNSEIAVVDKGQVRVIKNNFREEPTPSVVRIDPRGTVIVGKLAYNQRVEDYRNTHAQFKRLMGSQQILTFQASGRQMKPEELSAEVIKSLRQDAARELGEEVTAAVITIPAMFDIDQCEATRRAAELAGITVSPLLQEPIAAALAYGFQAESLEGFLLVYDLGGGTFDTSIIRSEEGRLAVVDHAGDNFLGGKDFDDKLVAYFIEILRREFGLRQLDMKRDRAAYAKLLFEAENARIQLSSTEKAYVSIAGLGKELADFEAAFEVTRSHYEGLIEPEVAKTVAICRRLLETNHLSRTDISRVILVGGPTLTPLVRAAIEDAVGVKPEFRVDPMTIVAQGAAIFAASQRMPEVVVKKAAKGTVALKLAYNPVSQDTETEVGGRVLSFGEGVSEVFLEISRADGGWSSGRLHLTGQAFMTPVILNSRCVNEFRVKGTDRAGNTVNVEPDHFSITHTRGPRFEAAPLSRSVRLGLSDGSTALLIPKGTTVPCSGRTKPGEIVTSHEINKGDEADVLNIPLLQGEDEVANRNHEIGTLRIKGTEITRSLPAGSEVEILVEVDRDFQVKVHAFIPFLVKTIDDVCPERVAPLPVLAELEKDFENEKERLTLVTVQKELEDLEPEDTESTQAEALVQELEDQLERARADEPDAAEKVRRRIEDLRVAIDRQEHAQKWPSLLHHLEEARRFASEAVENHGDEKDSQRLAKLLAEIEPATREQKADRLEKQISRLESFGWEIWARHDDFWVLSFQGVAKHAANFVDKRRGNSLLEEGRLAIERKDFASLRTIVSELWALVPDTEETKKEKLRFPASLRRKIVGYL
jgi:molecular chaperone DnaK